MNWDAIGALAELAGAIGVILSLVYLAFQIRLNSRQISQNSDFIESSIYQSVNDSALAWHALMAKDPQVANLWKKVRVGLDLSDDERAQAFSIVAMLFVLTEGQHKHFKSGVVSREPLGAGMETLLNRPYIAHWLDTYADAMLEPDFVTLIDQLRHKNKVSTE